MKKLITTIPLVVLVFMIALTSCNNNSSAKLDQAEAAAAEAEKNLVIAEKEYLAEMETYRTESGSQISSNQRTIEDLKIKIAESKEDVKTEYKETIEQLEQKNAKMKEKLATYKADGKEKWGDFKTEFNHDMDELGKALKDLTVNNTN